MPRTRFPSSALRTARRGGFDYRRRLVRGRLAGGPANWKPRKDAYPEGMGPVARAAKSNGMVYGLWFEFERVADGTWLAKNRPAWLLKSTSQPEGTYLLDLGSSGGKEVFDRHRPRFHGFARFRFLPFGLQYVPTPLLETQRRAGPDRHDRNEVHRRFVQFLG